MNLLLMGPIPPPIGGATVLFNALVEGIKDIPGVRLDVIDSTYRGGSASGRILHSFSLLFKLITRISSADVVFFHASLRGAVQFGFVFRLICMIFRKPWGFRGFGGNYLEWLEKRGIPGRVMLLNGVMSADVVLLETQRLISEMKKIKPADYQWYPNSRYVFQDVPDRVRCRRLVFVGHVKRSKGVEDLINIAPRLPKEISVDVYGPLQDGMTEQDFTVENISYKGVLAADEVLSVIVEYDALVFPTFYSGEGYPGVILEAYSCGLPVISTRWKMIPEIVDDASGILVDPRDREQLLKAICELAEDDDRYQVLVKGARDKSRLYDMEKWNEKFVDICKQMIDKKHA